ncbi:MAG: hypothetical protein AAF674_11800 [Pseudomonadota bacterium]
MTDKTTIRNLNPDLYTQAYIAAIEHNCSVADFIDDALEGWFGKTQKLEEDDQADANRNLADRPEHALF